MPDTPSTPPPPDPNNARDLARRADAEQAAGHARTAEQLRRDALTVHGDEGLDKALEGSGAADLDRATRDTPAGQPTSPVDVALTQRPPD